MALACSWRGRPPVRARDGGLLCPDRTLTVDVIFIGVALGTGLCRGSASSPSPTSWPGGPPGTPQHAAAHPGRPRRGPGEPGRHRLGLDVRRPRPDRRSHRPRVDRRSLPGPLRRAARCSSGWSTCPTKAVARRRASSRRCRAAQAAARRYPWLRAVPDPADPLPLGHAGDDLLQHPGCRTARQRPGQPGRDHRRHQPALVVGALLWERVLTRRAGTGACSSAGRCAAPSRRPARSPSNGWAGRVTARPRHLHPPGDPGQRRGQRGQVGLPRRARAAGGAAGAVGVHPADHRVASAVLAAVPSRRWRRFTAPCGRSAILLGLNLLAVVAAWRLPRKAVAATAAYLSPRGGSGQRPSSLGWSRDDMAYAGRRTSSRSTPNGSGGPPLTPSGATPPSPWSCSRCPPSASRCSAAVAVCVPTYRSGRSTSASPRWPHPSRSGVAGRSGRSSSRRWRSSWSGSGCPTSPCSCRSRACTSSRCSAPWRGPATAASP